MSISRDESRESEGLRDYRGFDAKTVMQIEHDNALQLLPRLKTLGL